MNVPGMNVWANVNPGTFQQVILDWLATNGGAATTSDIARLLESRGSPTGPSNARSPLDVLSKKGLIKRVASKRGPRGFTEWKLVAEPLHPNKQYEAVLEALHDWQTLHGCPSQSLHGETLLESLVKRRKALLHELATVQTTIKSMQT
jgi:hypothetical protein